MKTKLAALLTGVAMLGGGGIAQAEDVARTGAQTEAVAAGHARTSGPMILSDAQMSELTAGHIPPSMFRIEAHYAKYVTSKKRTGIWPFQGWADTAEGWHIDPGQEKAGQALTTPPIGCTAGGTCG